MLMVVGMVLGEENRLKWVVMRHLRIVEEETGEQDRSKAKMAVIPLS